MKEKRLVLLVYVFDPSQILQIHTSKTLPFHIPPVGAWNGSIQTLVCPNLARVVGIPTSGFHSRLKMRIFPHNLPRATYWRFLLLRCRTAGSLNHLPGRVVQCRGTYVPASGQQILYGSVDFPIPSIGLHLVPKMYHSGLCA